MSIAPENLEVAKYWQEWIKVGVSALTPVAIAVLTFYISNSLNEQQSYLRKGEQILTEKQKVYSELGPNINIIYAYMDDVGDFRQYEPTKIISLKREVDRKFYTYGPYWSVCTHKAYTEFMSTAFQMYVGTGQNAKLNTSIDQKRTASQYDKKTWNKEWDNLFTGESSPTLRTKYADLVTCLLNDIASSVIAAPKGNP